MRRLYSPCRNRSQCVTSVGIGELIHYPTVGTVMAVMAVMAVMVTTMKITALTIQSILYLNLSVLTVSVHHYLPCKHLHT